MSTLGAFASGDIATGRGSGAPPFFCIIVLVYNDYPHCLKAIESVISQTDGDFELVIVDNGSTDRTSAAIKSYLTDPRVSIVRLSANQRSDAIQTVANGTRCEFLSLLFADDTFAPTRLALARQVLTENRLADYVFFNNDFCDEGGSALEPDELPKRTLFAGDISAMDRFGHLRYSIEVGNSLHPCGMVIRADTYRALGGFPNTMHRIGDLAFFVRLLGEKNGIFRPEMMQKITIWRSGRNESASNETNDYQLNLERAQVLERWLEPGVFDNLERIFTYRQVPQLHLPNRATRLWFLAHQVFRCHFAEFQTFAFRLLYEAAAQGDPAFDQMVIKTTGFTPSQYIAFRVAGRTPIRTLGNVSHLLKRVDPLLRFLPTVLVRELAKLSSTIGLKGLGHRLWNHAADRNRMRSYR